ncbi:hypothetical protein [Owenweeksia hongkongensis]|uniref:hypothetical protein n=1 Tax=Owenweeksia hongkongensis TaxID=253245 RepID=UPI003A938E4E
MSSADSSRHAVEWFGALWTYTFKRRDRTFNEIYSEKNASKNRRIGFVLQLLAILIIIGIIILVISNPEVTFTSI